MPLVLRIHLQLVKNKTKIHCERQVQSPLYSALKNDVLSSELLFCRRWDQVTFIFYSLILWDHSSILKLEICMLLKLKKSSSMLYLNASIYKSDHKPMVVNFYIISHRWDTYFFKMLLSREKLLAPTNWVAHTNSMASNNRTMQALLLVWVDVATGISN